MVDCEIEGMMDADWIGGHSCIQFPDSEDLEMRTWYCK